MGSFKLLSAHKTQEGKMLKFLFVLPCLLAVAQPQSTRSLVQMVEMVIHVVDCSFFPIPYGCWCGFTLDPEPDMPSIDAFDESCKIHDFCYDSAVTSGCESYDEYLWPYEWIIDENDEIVCVEDQPDCQNRFATAIETLLMHSNRSLRCKMDVHGQTQAVTLQIHWLKRLSICTGSWQDKYLVIDCLCTVIFNKCSEYF